MKMIYKALLSVIIIALFNSNGFSQATLSIGTVSGTSGTSVSMPIQATGIIDMTGFQFTIAYDNTKLTFVNCTNWVGAVNAANVQINPLDGKLTFVYTDAAINIANGKFFDLNFTVLNGTSGNAPISWSDSPTQRELSNSIPIEISCIYSNGAVVISVASLLAPVATAATNIAQTSFSANWNSSATATGYRLDVALDNGFTNYLTGYQNKDVGNVTTFQISGGVANTIYYYRVSAYNTGETSGVSNTINLTTLQGLTLIPPVASAATNITQTGFSANWNSSATATGYRLDVAMDNTFTNYLTGYQNKEIGNIVTIPVTGLTANTTYYYRIKAYNSGETSGVSNTINVTTSSNQSGATLTIGNGTGTSGNTVSIPVSATNFSDVVGFQFTIVYDQTKLTFVNCTNWVAGLNATNVQINQLEGKLTFVYTDVAINITNGKFFDLNFTILNGTSGNASISWSDNPTPRELSNSIPNEISCLYSNGIMAISGALLLAPIANAAYNITQTSFIANWNSSATATGYRLEVALDNAFTNYLTGYHNKDNGNDTTLMVTGLAANTTYYYRTKAYNSLGTSGVSNTINVTTSSNQSGATLTIGNGTSTSGNTVSIPVTATNFLDVVGFQFTIVYDKTKLTFVNCTNWVAGLNATNVQMNQLDGKLTFVYTDVAINITNGKFFDLNFTVLNGTSGNAAISWSDSPTQRELSNSIPVEISCVYSDGTISIPICNTTGTPTSVSGSATGQTTANLSWSSGSPVGSSAVTYYWVVGTTSTATYGNGITQGTTTGTSATTSGLSAGITYYLRVYAKTSCDNTFSDYGTSSAFKTDSSCIAPTSPTSPTASQTTIASGQSTILQVNGGALNSASNWVWYTGSCGGTQIGTGTTLSVSPTVTTTYYVQASACGTTTTCKSITINFNDGNTVTDIDGNVYSTVTIGTQVWLGQNLKSTKYNDGTSIPLVTDNNTWITLSTHAYSWYNNEISYKDPFGALYNWYSVNTGKLCPSGWHVPTDAEWTNLTDYLGGEYVAGGKLKETGTTHWISPNTGATNESGFTALAGGFRFSDGTFFNIGVKGFWWSSTDGSSNTSWNLSMYYDNSGGYRLDYDRDYGYSVRCLCDILSSAKDELSNTNKIVFYPNPTKGLVNISIDKSIEGDFKINVYNNIGLLVKSKNISFSNNIAQIDLSGYSPGIYLIKIDINNDLFFGKIIKE